MINITRTLNRSCFTRYLENFPYFKVKCFFKNFFVLSAMMEWSRLDKKHPNILTCLTKHCQFIWLYQKSVHNNHKPKRVKFSTRLGLSLSHLYDHKFKHSFTDTLNPLSNCGKDNDTLSYYLSHCPTYLQGRMILFKSVRHNNTNILGLNDTQLKFFCIIRNFDKY